MKQPIVLALICIACHVKLSFCAGSSSQAPILQAPLGKATVDLIGVNPSGNNATNAESNLADVFCQALLWKNTAKNQLTVCFVNGGSYRDNIPSGNIFQSDIDKVYPWNDTVVQLRITGDTLLSLLKNGVTGYPSRGTFPQVGNIKYSFLPLVSLQNPDAYNTVLVNSQISNGTNVFGIGGNGEVVVVTTSYVADNSTEYPMLTNAKVVNPSAPKIKVTTQVGSYIKSLYPAPVNTTVDGRIVNCNGQPTNPLCVSPGGSSSSSSTSTSGVASYGVVCGVKHTLFVVFSLVFGCLLTGI